MVLVSSMRPAACHYCPRWVTAIWLCAGLIALVFASSCRSAPVIDTGPKPAVARGTLSGTVRGPEGASPFVGRTVTAINVDTGERHTAKTSSTGGFTIQANPGKYRLQVELREGETVVKAPETIDLNRSDLDAQIEIIIGPPRIARPRGPAYRVDNGLGAPTA
jgi:hypothetical protein